MIELFDGLDDTFRDILIQWMRAPTHHREICNHNALWKRKYLLIILGKTGGVAAAPPTPPPPPPLPSSLNFFWVLPWWHLSNWRLGDLVFPLFCALSIGRICSLMFRCVIQTFHVLALKFFFYLLVKKSFSLDLVVSFPSPSESLNCTWCTTKTHRNVYSRNARVPACSRVTWQIHLLGTSTWGHTCRSGCMLAPSPQKKSGRDSLSPFFSEGRGASVHRLDWWRKKSPSVLMQVMSKLSWKNNKKN